VQNDPNCQRLSAAFISNPLGNTSATPAQINAFLDSLCQNPCFLGIFAVLKSYGDCLAAHGMNSTFDSGIIGKALNFFCLKNPSNGQYCATLLLDRTFLNITEGRTPNNATICYGLSRFGCCLPPIFDFVDASEAALVKAQIRNTCGFALPPPCPKPGERVKFIKATWKIAGLAYTYFINNQERMGNALRKDIATKLNVDQGYVTLNAFRAGSVIVDFDVRGANDAATDALAAVVTSSASSSTTFPSTVAEAGTAGLDTPTSTVGVDTTGSSSTVETYTAPGAGSHVQPMFALVAALVALAFFTRQ
jgi:hypothetical protein